MKNKPCALNVVAFSAGVMNYEEQPVNKLFSISQWLYITTSALPSESETLSPTKCADGSVRLALATGKNETICEQYQVFKGNLERIVESLARTEYDAVFSVAVKAYEYIPEISFPPGLLQSLSRINSSIDVDVIHMVEEQS